MIRNKRHKAYSLAFYGRFLFKWRREHLDAVLRDDDWGLGRGPDGQRGIIRDIGPPDLFWRNGIHYYYTRSNTLSPLFDRLYHLRLGFGNGLGRGRPLAEYLVYGILPLLGGLYQLAMTLTRLYYECLGVSSSFVHLDSFLERRNGS